MSTTIQPATAAEATYSEIAADIWGVPAVTEYGYPLIQSVGTDTEGEPWYTGAPDADDTRYGVSGAGDEWRVVFASDGVVAEEAALDLAAACRRALELNETDAR